MQINSNIDTVRNWILQPKVKQNKTENGEEQRVVLNLSESLLFLSQSVPIFHSNLYPNTVWVLLCYNKSSDTNTVKVLNTKSGALKLVHDSLNWWKNLMQQQKKGPHLSLISTRKANWTKKFSVLSGRRNFREFFSSNWVHLKSKKLWAIYLNQQP